MATMSSCQHQWEIVRITGVTKRGGRAITYRCKACGAVHKVKHDNKGGDDG